MRFLLVLLAVAAACAQDGATHSDWPHYGGTQRSWRYSALDQINTGNVKNLVPVWMFQTGDYVENLQATPIVVDGVMFPITPRIQVFALDAATGHVLWQYKYPTPRPGKPGGMTFLQNRGVAVSDGKVFFGTTDNFGCAGSENRRRTVEGERRRSAPVRLRHHLCAAGGEGQDHRRRH